MRAILLFTTVLLAGPVEAQTDLTIISWNVQSGITPSTRNDLESDTDGVAREVGRLTELLGVDLWALSEVPTRPVARRYAEAAGPSYRLLLGRHRDLVGSFSSCDDRVAIVYDANRLQELGDAELFEWGVCRRRPLVARFRDRMTGTTFLFMANHLSRSNATNRNAEATELRQWAEDQGNRPVIAAGDYNMDVNLTTGDGNEAFDIMLDGGVWEWVRPAQLASTQCSVGDDGQCRFSSVLDFVFVAGQAQGWTVETSHVLADEFGFPFPPHWRASDHRPVLVTIEVPAG